MTEQNGKPIWSSIVFHANSGCDIRHKTNAAMNRCEDKQESNEPLPIAVAGNNGPILDSCKSSTGTKPSYWCQQHGFNVQKCSR